MQWIDALGYEEVMTFLRSTPANLFFKDTECRYLFISDVRTFFPYGEGQEEDVLGKTDLEIWSSERSSASWGLLVISRSGCGWKNRPRTGPSTMN